MNKYNKRSLSILVRKNIRKYRKLKNYTLQELADKCSLSHGYMRDLECLSIDKTPTLESLGLIAKALEIDIVLLFLESEDIPKTITKKTE